jgi:glutamate-ammonia-ligase adenylyltransferase
MTQRSLGFSWNVLPKVACQEPAAVGFERWREQAERLDDAELAGFARALADDAAGRSLLEAVFANSPFLTQCVLKDMGFFADLLSDGPEAAVDQTIDGLTADPAEVADRRRVMAELRTARNRVALAVGLADMAGLWTVAQVTEALSRFADAALSASVRHLLGQAAQRGDLALPDETVPERDCGFAILAMGKYGARELDRDKIDYRGRQSAPEAMARMTRELVTILEERTAEGFVFRTDLRLRPDPGAMPLAMSMTAALTYYESMGQNWERAAMIKARPAAGDLTVGRAFLAELRPFVWRKNLDFWAIEDIHSIKRQIHAHKGGGKIAVAGHNIKLGRGGIREIEFFAQTQQLIYGGRQPRLRSPRTVAALHALAEAGRIDRRAADELSQAYEFLRRLEHRLQMVDDQQTHRLPQDATGLARIAAFMGYEGPGAFGADLRAHLERVEGHYAELFEEAP